MTKEDRQNIILDYLLKSGSVQVSDLAITLAVSSVTIRKDLTELEKEGKLYRSHGRAILINPFTNNRSVNEKEKYYDKILQTSDGFYTNGVFGFVTHRNLVAMLISIELVLNAVDLNFAVFNRLLFPGQLEGFFFTLFSIGVSAAETAVALAIIINVYRNYHSDQVNSIENMKF